MRIHIKKLSFDAIVGILPHERQHPQLICLSAKIDYDFTNNQFIDYAHVCQIIEEDMKAKQYFLLEDALGGVHQTVFTAYPFIVSFHLKIFKPTILSNATVGLSHTFKH